MTLTRRDLQQLGANRWAMPLMAALDREGGIRFAVAAAGLGAPRNSLARTFEHVVAAGWVLRNPGHGHPLRPEYLLTETGRPIAAGCVRLMAARGRLGLAPPDLTRWTLPLIASLDGEHRRFNDLLMRMAPVSPRALSMTLKQGLSATLVDRRLEAAFPPTPLYGLTRNGLALAGALTA